jgi:hypothetical protein
MAADKNEQTSHEKAQEAQNGKPVFALVPFVASLWLMHFF